MDAVFLSRIQFALTAGFHYIYPQLSIGMGWLIFWIMTKHLRTGRPLYRAMARFWIHIFALTFAVGVATGIVMEFEFGTNWANYSRFVGDIFGAPLAAEGLMAFFLESTFLGMLLFGWKRLSVKVHWFSSLMVAIGTTMSAFWIIVANSWQQTPTGYRIVEGRAELVDFAAAVFNPSMMPRFEHVIVGTLIAGSFFMMGLSAYFLIKKRHLDFAKESFRIAMTVALIAAAAQWVTGHHHAVQVAKTQPTKLAAMEGLWETQTNAPLLVIGWPDTEAEKNLFEIKLPGLLSFGVYGDWNAEMKGLKEWPREERPPIFLTFFPFHFMVGLGAYFLLFSALAMFLRWRDKLWDAKWFHYAALFSIPLPIASNLLGWITAEVGRQPWIVYGLLRTRDGYSPAVPAAHILTSIIFFTLIYSLLLGLWVFMLRRTLIKGPEPVAEAEEVAS